MTKDRPSTLETPEHWDAAAAEYVLGLLTADEHTHFEQELGRQTDLQHDVGAWELYFGSLTESLKPVEPPPQILRRIEVLAFGEPKRPSLLRQLMPYIVGGIFGAALAYGGVYYGLITP